MSLLFAPTRISLLSVMLAPSPARASVVIRLLSRNWMSRARKLILPPIPNRLVASMVALVLRAIESATTLMLPAAPVPKLWTPTAAPSRTLNRPVAMLKLPAAPDAGCSPNKIGDKSIEDGVMALGEPRVGGG